ncbi:D-lactate dehydrogenase [Artemisia annua]|uniref:D-lactate dehydrogenase n=1 Tax=Artemisia annua TaxID=35608 RepID=A0A2U1LU85_ARTAN|nr:D-lactate dehydrogenase [Artemisia annua]
MVIEIRDSIKGDLQRVYQALGKGLPSNELVYDQEAERLSNFMVHAALSTEGTCTGEHGLDTWKMKARDFDGESLRNMLPKDESLLGAN